MEHLPLRKMTDFTEHLDTCVPRSAQEKMLEDVINGNVPGQNTGETEAEYFQRFEAHYGFKPIRISGEQLLQKLLKRRADHDLKLLRIENSEMN